MQIHFRSVPSLVLCNQCNICRLREQAVAKLTQANELVKSVATGQLEEVNCGKIINNLNFGVLMYLNDENAFGKCIIKHIILYHYY